MAIQPPPGGWGDEEWADDEKVRTIAGESVEPWKTFDACCGPWKFPNGLMNFLKDAGFKCPTPIQAHTWPVLLNGKDVIGVAKTGSGKTLGYLLPGYIKVKRANRSTDWNVGPQMLVIAPTRELCQQIYEESEKFGTPAGIKTACCFGGAPKGGQTRQLYSGPECVCATPGRLHDFLKEGSIKLGNCDYLVLDEADRMLDMGFLPQVREIVPYLASFADRQTALFTATWPREVAAIARDLTKDPTHIQVGTSDAVTTNADITQIVKIVHSEGDKMKFIENDVFQELQASGQSALIFMKTKRSVADTTRRLQRAGAPICCLHGDMEQRERDAALHSFKVGQTKVLLATDVAQRGLDLKNIGVVVNYDPPGNMEDYTHRIGRTGRAGAKGTAYTFLYPHEGSMASQIIKVMKKAGQKIPPELQEIASGSTSASWGSGGGSWGNWGSGGSNGGDPWGGWNKSGDNGGGGGGGGSKWDW
mmetsp:Transcript_33053/g.77296  ORF Transcript_33053/g.77296 Transcript_33053/m.77296 type:complete len:475 (-) Transcript_33053:208-1632(-)